MILYLIRHAKSSWDQQGLSDHERPLNKRGHKDAPRMFERLRTNATDPEIIVSSDAARAAATARLLLESLQMPVEQLTFTGDLYHANVERIVETARSLADEVIAAAIVGHNPGMTYAANHLAENLDLDNLPTCGIVGIEFNETTWPNIDTGELSYFDYPKNADGPLVRNQDSL